MELEEAVHVLTLLAGRESGFATPSRTRDAARVVLDHLSVQAEPEWEYGVLYAWNEGLPQMTVEWESIDQACEHMDVGAGDVLMKRTKAKSGPWVPVQAPEGEKN